MQLGSESSKREGLLSIISTDRFKMDNRTESEKGDKGLYEYACVEELGNRMSYFISESVNMDEQTIEEPTEETVETVEDFLSSKLASGS